MDASTAQGTVSHASEKAVPSEGQRATTMESGANIKRLSVDAHPSDPKSPASDPSGVPGLDDNIPKIEKDPNLDMNIQTEPGLSQGSSKAGTKRTTQSSDAIRRGLSFGPIKKQTEHQSATKGVLKTSSKSPSSRLHQRSASSSGDGPGSENVGRQEKDYEADNDDGEDAEENSDIDAREWSSEDESSPLGKPRGRNRDGPEGSETLTAAEGDKPEVTITAPEGEKPVSTSKRFDIVRPNTNFDQSVSKTPSPGVSPFTTDSEEMEDIRQAQKLNVICSSIDSTIPHRLIQTIFRGRFLDMLKESEEGTRRIRDYLIATDLSEEAFYALEWTIGTVLRDGDTLYAIYAMDDETGTAKTGDAVPIGEGGKAMQDTTAVMEKMTAATKKGALMSLPSSLSKAAFRTSSRSSSAVRSDSDTHAKAAQDRLHALEKLSETCLGFLRGTGLQVRVVIEVIHCKSSRHMITEAVSSSRNPLCIKCHAQNPQIDILNPTLVIIGSRGRGTLKGYVISGESPKDARADLRE